MQLLAVVGRSRFHQQSGHPILDLYRLAHHQVAVAQHGPELPHFGRGHIGLHQKIATGQIGDLARVQSIALVLPHRDGFEHSRMGHLQLFSKRFQSVVDPSREQGRLHPSNPLSLQLFRPSDKILTTGWDHSLINHLATGPLGTVAHRLLVDVQTHVVCFCHWRILLACRARARLLLVMGGFSISTLSTLVTYAFKQSTLSPILASLKKRCQSRLSPFFI